jgi:hypothetical protein
VVKGRDQLGQIKATTNLWDKTHKFTHPKMGFKNCNRNKDFFKSPNFAILNKKLVVTYIIQNSFSSVQKNWYMGLLLITFWYFRGAI